MNEDLTNSIVVTSRVRLARNLADTPFPHKLDAPSLQRTMDAIIRAAEALDLTVLYADDMEEAYKLWLMEEHLVSRDFVRESRGALLLSQERDIAIMLMEEDHLRMQCLLDGLALREAQTRITAQHEILEQTLSFAQSEQMGYLTACPSNVGTGLRASALMHLPALMATGRARNTFNGMRDKGVVIRGLYGEGSEATGHMFQISNRISLGRRDEALIAMMTQVILRICQAETRARQTLLDAHRVDVEDRVYRSFGILRYAKKLSEEEAMAHISNIMLGVSIGLLDVPVDPKKLMGQIQPGHLQMDQHNVLPQDMQRAALCAKAMDGAADDIDSKDF